MNQERYSGSILYVEIPPTAVRPAAIVAPLSARGKKDNGGHLLFIGFLNLDPGDQS